ncbi:hypothetical protein DRE_00886 [Drechslerella stenobrocha 248]|uniref:FAM50A/XAP5 C-terminal domain-containing protein n=1 Tax=Drechslerella stenobrocha 248 TaxID=1043628 RepID=W7HZ72_9PEZI|nr:hypothetical protein DRE_00886 [Drechslerella stenobrocha 248]
MPPSNVSKKPPAPAATAATPAVDRPTHNFRFTAQNETLEDVLKSQTVGLVHLSDFKKRRAELLEQKEREAANANQSAPGSVGGGSKGAAVNDGNVKPPAPKKRKKTATSRGLLSFDDGDGDDDSSPLSSMNPSPLPTSANPSRGGTPMATTNSASTPPPEKLSDKTKDGDGGDSRLAAAAVAPKRKFNTNLPAPTVLTKASLRKEAEMREALRKEFNKLQDQIRNEEISIPFVFYDGTNVPGGECKMKKGEAVWLFLERARRTRGLWHRVSVDDLMFVRGEIIIPHHYEFYYFIVNGTVGPHGKLFDYPSALTLKDGKIDNSAGPKDKDGKEKKNDRPPDDPTMTKVVDRRWYERNKHIFPASMWETFDPNKDYANMVRRDKCENSFFFS